MDDIISSFERPLTHIFISNIVYFTLNILGEDGKFVIAGNPIKIQGVDDLTIRPNAPLLNGDREKILMFADVVKSKL